MESAHLTERPLRQFTIPLVLYLLNLPITTNKNLDDRIHHLLFLYTFDDIFVRQFQLNGIAA